MIPFVRTIFSTKPLRITASDARIPLSTITASVCVSVVTWLRDVSLMLVEALAPEIVAVNVSDPSVRLSAFMPILITDLPSLPIITLPVIRPEVKSEPLTPEMK